MAKKCKCGKQSVFFRKYEGSYLCKECFCRSVERKVKRNIRQNNLLERGDKIAVALSGGKDSASVLNIMNQIIKPRKDMEIFAITVDEGVKEYRDKAIESARSLCKKLGIKHHVVSFKEEFGKSLDEKVKRTKEVPCTLCGVGRRNILNKKARELGATKLCLGHNLDDESQSAMMNILRGDLPRAARMGPTPVKYDEMFIPRIKPLRMIPEKETALYAMLKELDFHKPHCPYRSGVRNEVRDFLNEIEANHEGTKFTLLETFDRLIPCIRDVSEREGPKVVHCRKCGEPSSRKLCKTCEIWR